MFITNNRTGNMDSVKGDTMKITLNREFHIGSFLTGILLSGILVIIGGIVYFK